MERPSNTTLALLGGMAILIALITIFALTRDPDQDVLGDSATTFAIDNPDLNKACSGQAVYNQIKRALFNEAMKLRGQDAGDYQRLASSASIRMENATAEGEGRSPGLVDCSGSMAIDLPPGITTAAGRRLLMSDIYYAVDPQSERVVQLRNADRIVAELAGLAVVPVAPAPIEPANETEPADPLAPLPPDPPIDQDGQGSPPDDDL